MKSHLASTVFISLLCMLVIGCLSTAPIVTAPVKESAALSEPSPTVIAIDKALAMAFLPEILEAHLYDKRPTELVDHTGRVFVVDEHDAASRAKMKKAVETRRESDPAFKLFVE